MLSVFRFFIYSNLFMAACSVLMVNQTYSFVLQNSPNTFFLAFVFFATMCSYSFHWWLTSESLVASPRITWVKKYKTVHLVFFFIGLAGAGILFFYLFPWWYWLSLSAVITFLYSAPKVPHPFFRALRKVAVGKTIFLSLVWTYVTAILPVIINGSSWNVAIVLYIFNRFFFIYAICIMFDFRDRQDDKAAGIRSMVTWFSEKGVNRLFYLSLIISDICALLLRLYGFSWISIIVLIIPAIIAQIIYNYAKTNFSDILYYFILDGLMMFSALLMLVLF
jgi:4-hydroxybenzoate polyprenyltransferase